MILDDPKSLFAAQNVVSLITKSKVNPTTSTAPPGFRPDDSQAQSEPPTDDMAGFRPPKRDLHTIQTPGGVLLDLGLWA